MNKQQANDVQWLLDAYLRTIDTFTVRSPVEYNEEKRYLPSSVTSDPGYISFYRTPYWIEILECFDIRSPVREVAVLKAVQTAYSTILESIVMYFAGHVRTAPVMYANNTIDAAQLRISNNYIPMFEQSNMDHIFKSSHTGNSRKQGITKKQMQWIGGGYMVPRGAQNAHMMREIAIMCMLMDELDAWPDVPDGDPVQLFKDRTTGFTENRKIFMGCTPTITGSSRIERQFLRGDQRKYHVRCLKCGEAQELRFSGINKDTGKTYGLKWDTNDGTLDIDSVRYHCRYCNNPHEEHDKIKFITKDNAFWKPTAKPVEPNLRSYQVTGLMSRRSPWYKGVSMWLEAYDTATGRTKNHAAMMRFYNNFLAETFEEEGDKIPYRAVSSHRRHWYTKGQIINTKIAEYCASEILFLTMTVDVHKHHLNVAIWGWTAGDGHGFNPWLVDYYQIQDDSETGFESIDAEGWGQLGDVIDRETWVSDDGKEYRLAMSLIDARYNTDVVLGFCSQWPAWVYPIMGTERSANTKTIQPFRQSKTKSGYPYFLIMVDDYKDRNAPALRRRWRPEHGIQRPYTFNAPTDATDDEIKELTREYRKEIDPGNSRKGYKWHRPHGADNELWDLLNYGHASVDILAWIVCEHYGLETVDLQAFWEYCKSNPGEVGVMLAA